MSSRTAWRGTIVVWLLAWAVFGLPWTGWTRQPQVDSVRWTLYPGYRAAADAVLNIAFYMPFGAFAAAQAWSWSSVLGAAAVLSLVTEVSQLYSISRFPALPDLLFNVLGAATGAAAASAIRR